MPIKTPTGGGLPPYASGNEEEGYLLDKLLSLNFPTRLWASQHTGTGGAQIQNAIDSLGVGGGLVIVDNRNSDGTADIYMASSSITIPDNVGLKIPQGVTVKLADSVDDDLIRNADQTGGNSNIAVFGKGTLHGNGVNQTAAADSKVLSLVACDNVYLGPFTAQNAHKANIEIEDCSYPVVAVGTRAKNGGRQQSGTTALDNWYVAGTSFGVYLIGVSGDTSYRNGITFEGTAHDNVVLGGYFTGNSVGIWFEGSGKNVAIAPNCYHNGILHGYANPDNIGEVVFQDSECSLIGGTLDVDATGVKGIRIGDAGHKTIIKGNHIYANDIYGIGHKGGDAVGVSIIGNLLYDYGISTRGLQGSIIANNKVFNSQLDGILVADFDAINKNNLIVGNMVEGGNVDSDGIKVIGNQGNGANDIRAYNNYIYGTYSAKRTDISVTRMVWNGNGVNAGDPGAGGDWNGNGYEGVIVRDTTNNNTYIDNNGVWSQIAST